MLQEFKTRVITAVVLLASATCLGVIGYMAIEGHSFIDALYMTVITLATVGYGEVKPLTPEGKVFTIFLIISTIGIFTYTISTISSFLVDGQFRRAYQLYRINKMVTHIKDHVIVCGFGRNGSKVVEELRKHRLPYVVIDTNPDVYDVISKHEGMMIVGNATDDEVLRQANIKYARALITALPSDADNVFVVLTARSLCEQLIIISRASREPSVNKLKTAGANHVVMPDKIGGQQMASLVIRPDVTQFLELLTHQSGPAFQIAELDYKDLAPRYQPLTVGELDVRKKTGASIIGFKKSNGEYVINPEPEVRLGEHCKLLAIGTSEQIASLQQFLRGS